jgi:hypothetical protein
MKVSGALVSPSFDTSPVYLMRILYFLILVGCK